MSLTQFPEVPISASSPQCLCDERPKPITMLVKGIHNTPAWKCIGCGRTYFSDIAGEVCNARHTPAGLRVDYEEKLSTLIKEAIE